MLVHQRVYNWEFLVPSLFFYQGLVNVLWLRDLFHITKTNICWRLYHPIFGWCEKNGTFTNPGLSTLIWLLASKIMICSLALVHRKKWGCALKIDGFYYRIFPTETCHKLGPWHVHLSYCWLYMISNYIPPRLVSNNYYYIYYLGLFLSYPHHIKNGVMMMFP